MTEEEQKIKNLLKIGILCKACKVNYIPEDPKINPRTYLGYKCVKCINDWGKGYKVIVQHD